MTEEPINKEDALAHAGKKPKFSKKDKIEFAKKKQEEETAKALNDPKVVEETAKKFESKVNEDREKAGLPKEKKVKAKKLPTIVNTKRYDKRNIKVPLSDKEINEAGREIAHKQKQYAEIEEEMKGHMSNYKDRLKEIKTVMNTLGNKVTLKYEYREFSCEIWLNFKTKKRVYKDRNTGKEIDSEDLHADDYQLRLAV